MRPKLNEVLSIKVNQKHIEIINAATGSGKVNYSAAVRHAIEQTYGQKKVG